MYQKPDYGQTDIYNFILPFSGHDEFVSAVEKYHEGFGYYPERILADKIYRNRKNRGFCKRNHIKISDPKVGKPGKRKLGLGLMKCQSIPQKKARKSIFKNLTNLRRIKQAIQHYFCMAFTTRCTVGFLTCI